jgi:hypothetical protein
LSPALTANAPPDVPGLAKEEGTLKLALFAVIALFGLEQRKIRKQRSSSRNA